MRRRKDITLRSGELLHVETPNGIVNIYAGLTDRKGRTVDAVTFIPDNYAGEAPVRLWGTRMVRLLRVPRAKVVTRGAR